MVDFMKECRQFNRMMANIGCGILCCENDSALTLKFAGSLFYRILGYAKEEVTALLEPQNSPVLRNETPIDWKAVVEEIRQKGYATPEMRLIKKDGHHLWARYRVGLMTGEDGKEYFSGIIYDITLQRRQRRLAKEQAEELRALTMNVPGGVLRNRCDEYLSMDLVSEGFCRMTGYSGEEIAERFKNRFLNMVREKDRGLLKNEVQIGKTGITELTYGIVGKNDRLIWVLDKARSGRDCNGGEWVYRVLIDITDRKKAQDELAASEERYRMIFENAAESVMDYDGKKRQFYYSPAFLEKFGRDLPDKGELLRYFRELDIVYPEDRDGLIEKLKELFLGETVGDGEYRLKTSDGNYIWCSLHFALFYDAQGAVSRVITMISDIDQQKKEAFLLREKAEHDLLTGLFNRMTTTKLIEEIIARSGKGERHALFVIDIDNFKNVNDCMGHLCGDRLIMDTAWKIKSQFREEDIVGRIGGDEFVVFLKNITSVELIVKKAETLRNGFRETKNPAGKNCFVSGSIGVSFYPYDGVTYEELFRKADTAMYAAKKGGKDSYRVYTQEISDSLSDREDY